MLDVLISYLNFLIISIPYIVKRFTFMPPNPPKYLIQKNQKNKEEIKFLLKNKEDDLVYQNIKPKNLKIKCKKLFIPPDNKVIPILIITPIIHIPICIIYCQGNSGDLAVSLFECHEIALNCNVTIVTFEYPGYGICKDEPIKESEFFNRIEIIYNFIINELKYKPSNIFLYGFSLGTGIVFDFACRKKYPVAGLILQSPFLSILRTIINTKKTMYFDLFNNCDKAKYIKTKTLFLHGNRDKTVPYIHGRILSKLIPEKYFYDFLTVDNANHNDLLKSSKPGVFKYIYRFILDCIDDSNTTYIINNFLDKASDESHNKTEVKRGIISENIELNAENDEDKKINIFKRKKALSKIKQAKTYFNYKLNKLNNIEHYSYKICNQSQKKEPSKNKTLFEIESNHLEILSKNIKINQPKNNNIINNNYYIVKLTNNDIMRRMSEMQKPIYNRPKKINNNKNKNNDYNYNENFNSVISINSSHTNIFNNK